MSSRVAEKQRAREIRTRIEREEHRQAVRRRRLIRLGAVVAVALAAVAAIVLVAGGGDRDGGGAAGGGAVAGVGDSRAMLEGIPQEDGMLGHPDAPLVVTEYADLQCPFCADYGLQVMPGLIERYVRTGRIRMDLELLRFIGPDSDRGARAAHAAAAAGKGWDFVDLWYRNQGAEGSGYADDDFIAGIASAAGVDPKDALDAVTSDQADMAIAESEARAQAAAIDSTPSFTIGPPGGPAEPLQVSELTLGAFEKALKPHLAALK